MADVNKITTDGWGPWGPPSTWRKKFQEQEYNEFAPNEPEPCLLKHIKNLGFLKKLRN